MRIDTTSGRDAGLCARWSSHSPTGPFYGPPQACSVLHQLKAALHCPLFRADVVRRSTGRLMDGSLVSLHRGAFGAMCTPCSVNGDLELGRFLINRTQMGQPGTGGRCARSRRRLQLPVATAHPCAQPGKPQRSRSAAACSLPRHVGMAVRSRPYRPFPPIPASYRARLRILRVDDIPTRQSPHGVRWEVVPESRGACFSPWPTAPGNVPGSRQLTPSF